MYANSNFKFFIEVDFDGFGKSNEVILYFETWFDGSEYFITGIV